MRAEMERFLGGVERRAYRMSEIATGNREEALDIVQDAMLALVRKYSDRPEAQWAPLFHRILQNQIRDWQRRRSVRQKVFTWLKIGNEEDGVGEPLESLPDPRSEQPERGLQREALAETLELALRRLPLRQQQAFMLRAWEGLDTAATADAMGCSAGSVKTHYSRALAALRGRLEVYR
jgi:RNA polymerase sigma-70 factor (ECF subfamily)